MAYKKPMQETVASVGPEKPIEFGIRKSVTDFDRRPAVGEAGYKFGKKTGHSGPIGNAAKQSKKSGMGDRGQK